MATETLKATKTPTNEVPRPFTVKSAVKKSAMAALKAKADAAVASRRAAGMSARKDPVERASDDPKSKTKAIAATCYQCQNEDADPCWQWRVGNCEIPNCGSYRHRPHQRLYGKPTPKALLEQFDAPAPFQLDEPVRATGGRQR